ncbi:MAG: flavin reductase family protein [Pseudomonadota bacterium]|nr:flavin reductase family protein [Pseudomonadota bacterium]
MNEHRTLRNAFGQFGTGVAIITLADPQGSTLGLTVNSFSSVSLDPPLISWCLANDSDMMTQFADANRFCANILSAEQQELSNAMARPGTHELEPCHVETSASGDRRIVGALAYCDCRVHERIVAGDHIISIGYVESVDCAETQAAPLLYFRGGYAGLA